MKESEKVSHLIAECMQRNSTNGIYPLVSTVTPRAQGKKCGTTVSFSFISFFPSNKIEKLLNAEGKITTRCYNVTQAAYRILGSPKTIYQFTLQYQSYMLFEATKRVQAYTWYLNFKP